MTAHNSIADRPRNGVTLIEMMIVVTIFSVVVLGTFQVLTSVNDNLAVDIPLGDLENKGRRLVEQMERMIRPSSATQITVSSTNSWINFKVPVDHDADGDVLDDSFAIEWGAFEEGVPTLSNWTYYYFNVTGTYFEGTSGNIDLNRDGDKTDQFYMGDIIFWTQGGWTRRFGNGMVCVDYLTVNGDVNGDGTPDPIFTLDGNSVTVNLWMARVVADNQPILVNTRSTFPLRN